MKKNIALLATLIAILGAACTHDNENGGTTPIGIGRIAVSAGTAIAPAGTRAIPAHVTTLTVTADGTALANTYTYNGSAWAPATADLYLEDVRDATYTYTATTGTQALCTDQTTLAAYHAADYIAGPVLLNTTAPAEFYTPDTDPLTHQHVDVVLTLAKGTDWPADPAFADAMAQAEILFYTTGGTPIKTYRDGTTARAIIPYHSMPTPGATLATIQLTGDATPQAITYTLADPADLTAGTRLNIAANYHNQRAMDGITLTITPWTEQNEPELPAPIVTGYDRIIATKADLMAFRDLVNAGGNNNLRALQVADIDLEGEEWEPIGNYNFPYNGIFTGSYNGGGHTIKGLAIKNAPGYVGLFGWVGPGALLADMHLDGVEIETAASFAGALAGYVYGEISATPVVIHRCTARGKVVTTSGFCAGGLVGSIGDAHITYCHAQCTVAATGTGNSVYAGGLTGLSNGVVVVACSATGNGDIAATDLDITYAGGLIGYNQGTIRFCRATQTATANGNNRDAYAGGLVGNNRATISGSYATGGATATATGGTYQGTFAGYNSGNASITHCHAATGTAVGDSHQNATATEVTTTDGRRYATVTGDTNTQSAYIVATAANGGLEAKLVDIKATDVWQPGENDMPTLAIDN